VSADSEESPGFSVVDDISYVTVTAHVAAESRDAPPSSDVIVGSELLMMTALPIEPPLYATIVDYYRLPPPPYEQAINYTTNRSEFFG